jgi:pilus assembly protein Flp/PilA
MSSVISRIRDFVVSEDGPTAVEYAVMLSLIIVACISIVTTLGKTVSNTFGSATSAIGS